MGLSLPLGRMQRRGRHTAASVLLLAGSALAPLAATAQTVQWVNPASGNWGAPANWSVNVVPGAADDVLVDRGSAQINAQSFSISEGLVSGSTVSIRAAGGLSAGSILSMEGNGTVQVQDAGSRLTVTGPIFVGERGTGVMRIIDGGKVTGGDVFIKRAGSEAVIDGAGSMLTTTTGAGLSLNRGGALTVRNQAVASVGADFIVGDGTALIDGTGSAVQVARNSLAVLGLNRDDAGTLTLQNGGRLTATAVTLGYSARSTGTLNIGTGAAAGILDAGAVVSGSGVGHVVFNHSDNIAVGNSFIGNLDLVKRGIGTLQMNAPGVHEGATSVEGGTLRAGAADVFSRNSAHSVSAGATLDLAGFDQGVASLTNAGTVSLVGTAPGTTLNVVGAYVGNNGVLRLGTRLGDSASVSDRMVLDGPLASASGSTTVQVTNLGGLGAATTGNGIEVIAARNGATTTAQTTQNAFTLANGAGVIAKGAANLQATTAVGGHVDAGAYEYRLYAADAAGAGESWFLRSTVTAVGPVGVPVAPPVTPPAVGSPATSDSGTGTGTDAGGEGGGATAAAAGTNLSIGGAVLGAPFNPLAQVTAYRAEVPLYASVAAQLRQGNLAMLGNRHQRVGDDDAGGKPGSSQGASDLGERRAWGRVLSTDLDIRQGGTVSPASQGRLSGFQVGTDVFATREFRGGIYVGQLDGNTRVNGFASGIVGLDVGSTDLRSQYFGAYGTYTPANGWYVDAVLQAGRHRYTVQPTLNLATGAKGSSLLASVEVGKSFDLVEGGAWKIEPSVQLAHQRLSLDDSAIPGALVQQDPHSGWIARAGVRVKGEFATGAGLLQPYARVNLYRSASGNDVTRFVGPAGSSDILSAAGSSSTELAGGFTLALNERASIYAEAGKLWSSSGDAKVKSGLQGSLGLRVRW